MRNAWKWVAGIVGGLVVLGLIAAAVLARFFWRVPFAAAQRGFVPRGGPFQGVPGQGMQRIPHMFGGMGGFGHMGFGGGGLFMFLPHLIWNLLLLALVVAGVIFLVRAFSRPRAGAAQAAAAAPAAPVAPVMAAPAPIENTAVEQAPLRTCVSCGRELQAGWTHCPHCGTPI